MKAADMGRIQAGGVSSLENLEKGDGLSVSCLSSSHEKVNSCSTRKTTCVSMLESMLAHVSEVGGTITDHSGKPLFTILILSPGLMIRPKLDILEVVYGSNSSWQKYVDGLNSVLQDYNKSVQEERGSLCTSGVYNKQEDTGDVRNYPKKACQFLREYLGNCSGIDDPTYGYSNGTPCVLIKMNRVINFLPEPIKDLSNTSITINCSGKNEENDRLLGARQYFPGLSDGALGTIDLMYFPYYGNRAQKNYTQPFVAVKFLNVTHNVDHNVECRVNAANINSQDERDKFQGRVIFRLRIDS